MLCIAAPLKRATYSSFGDLCERATPGQLVPSADEKRRDKERLGDDLSVKSS